MGQQWHRVFVFVSPVTVLPSGSIYAIARADDVTLGILQSRIHQVWTLEKCTWIGVGNDPRYTPTTTLETFPFPRGLEPNKPPSEFNNLFERAIREATIELMQLRGRWLNPPEWITVEPEVVPGYPDRLVPIPKWKSKLRKRTMTALYNEFPAWLQEAHNKLDLAVLNAYGWPSTLAENELLERLLTLNRERAVAD